VVVVLTVAVAIMVAVAILKENFPHLIQLLQLILNALNSMIKIKLFKKMLFNLFFFRYDFLNI
jgi:hypothetical protein